MKRRIAAMRSATLGEMPRRMACRVMMPKKTSTRFIQLSVVGVKCSCTPGACLGELPEEPQELLVAAASC
jgi:hypothetical protein